LANIVYKSESQGIRIELKEFLVIFLTIAILSVLAIERFTLAKQRSAKRRAEKTVAEIIRLERAFNRDHGCFGTLTESGFVNPFCDNSVEFTVSFDQNGFFVQASENLLMDTFGDKIPGNEYFVGYANGSIEYNKKH
jgi:Tfp pilus assembly protein PilE